MVVGQPQGAGAKGMTVKVPGGVMVGTSRSGRHRAALGKQSSAQGGGRWVEGCVTL